MRKVIASPFITLDGFIAGPQGEVDWAVGGEEFDRDMLPLLLKKAAKVLWRISAHSSDVALRVSRKHDAVFLRSWTKCKIVTLQNSPIEEVFYLSACYDVQIQISKEIRSRHSFV